MKSESESGVAQSCLTLCNLMDTRLLHPWDFLGTSTGVGCRFLLQGTSRPRDQTQVSHIVDRRFPSEPPLDLSQKAKFPKKEMKTLHDPLLQESRSRGGAARDFPGGPVAKTPHS